MAGRRVEGSVPLVAVVGTGSIGMRHLNILQKIPGVLPLAIPVRPERAGVLSREGISTVSGLGEAVEKGATHCIIATDTRRHAQDARAALECGINVLVEKPLALNAHQARDLALRAKQTGRNLFVGCVLRFSESLGFFRDQLKRIGRPHHVRIECQSYLPDWRPGRPYRDSYSARAGEGGVLRDLIHEIDYAGWIFAWPPAIRATVKNLGRLGIEAEEMAELTWESSEGCIISMALDYLSRPSRRTMRACGERGTLEWDGITGKVVLEVFGKEKKTVSSTQPRDGMYVAQIRAFLKASRDTCDPRLASADDGVRALAVCDAARCAARNGSEEEVKYP